MATPHVAGLVAYYLSLYPSVTFNPTFDPSLVPSTLLGTALNTANPTLSTVLNIAHAVLPNWATAYLPSTEAPKMLVAAVAPVPKPITPAQLKKALLDLSTGGILTSLPANTPNKVNITSLYLSVFFFLTQLRSSSSTMPPHHTTSRRLLLPASGRSVCSLALSYGPVNLYFATLFLTLCVRTYVRTSHPRLSIM